MTKKFKICDKWEKTLSFVVLSIKKNTNFVNS